MEHKFFFKKNYPFLVKNLAVACLLIFSIAGCSDRAKDKISYAPVYRDKSKQPYLDLREPEPSPYAERVAVKPNQNNNQPRNPVTYQPLVHASDEEFFPKQAAYASDPYYPDDSKPYESAPYHSAAAQAARTTDKDMPPIEQGSADSDLYDSDPADQPLIVTDYRVQPNDSLANIGRKYNRSVEMLAKENFITMPYILTVGQGLKLSRTSAPLNESQSFPDSTDFAAARPVIHKIKGGETVYGISRQYGVDIRTVIRLNNIKPPYQINPDRELIIPASDQGLTQVKSPIIDPYDPKNVPWSAHIIADQTGPTDLPNLPRRVRDKLKLPTDGPIIARFGPMNNGEKLEGTVFGAAEGTAIVAAENGVVAYSGNGSPDYGNMAVILHDGGWTTVYAHASMLNVRRGEVVGRGQSIGSIGQTGSAMQPALLFELRYADQAVDPEPYFDMPNHNISMR